MEDIHVLYEMVQKDQLPPLEERLPKNPLVIKPYEEVGRYGGTFRRGTGFFMPDEWLASHIDPNSFWRFQWPFPGSGPVLPSIADWWKFNDEGKELTIHIREGIKWSDGTPFTIDDVLFFLNDVVGDEKVTYTWYHTANLYIKERQLPKIQKIDNYTIKLTYPEPSFFVETMYAPLCEIALPAHVLKQHHPKYNPGSTYDKFNEQLVWANGRGKVTLNAWMLESFAADKKLTVVRNPYYWKVDTAGNQLPYFDRMDVFVTGDRQGVALGNATGKFDNDAMWVGIQHLSLFLEEEAKRDITIGHSIVGGMGIYFNVDTDNPRARKVIRNTDFRRALSLAINRPKIGKVFFYDTLVPMGSSFSPNSAYFEEQVGKLYSEFDPEKAKKILNDAGIIDRDGDGIRELPSGEKCELIWSVYEHDLYTPIAEMVAEDVAKVGIKLILNIKHQNIILDQLLTSLDRTLLRSCTTRLTRSIRRSNSLKAGSQQWRYPHDQCVRRCRHEVKGMLPNLRENYLPALLEAPPTEGFAFLTRQGGICMGMITYILRRVLLAIPLMVLISILCFIIIQLPPGDYLSSYGPWWLPVAGG